MGFSEESRWSSLTLSSFGLPKRQLALASSMLLLSFSVNFWRKNLLPDFTADGPAVKTAEGKALQWSADISPWEDPSAALQDYTYLLERVTEEHGWRQERAEGAVAEYLRFLQMLAEAPAMELVASSDVDLVWHEHLMDTRNYAADTSQLYGRYLHHRRARTSEEFADIPGTYARTKTRYAERFGRPPPSRFWGASTEASSMCGGGGLDPSQSGPASSGTSGSNTSVTPAPSVPQESSFGRRAQQSVAVAVIAALAFRACV